MPRPGRRLLARLQRARPKLLVLIAPAGYGKSTLARHFAEGRAHAVCDCGLAQGRAEFIRRVLATLAQVLPEARLNLQRAQLVLGSEAEERFGIEAALEAWAAPCDDSLFIFENVEKLLETGAGEDLLARFLASRPENRVVVICSRLPLRVRLTRFAAPHEIVTLHAADLALTPEETLSFFPRLKPEAAASVVALCRGWPIAVLLLARFAREGSLEEVLARSGDLPSGELYEYLWDEVLASAGIQSLPGLLACALLPGATPRELAWALDDDARRVEAFAAWAGTLPLIGLTAGSTYEAHPLVRATLETGFPQRRRELLLDMAARQREHGDAPRAAELYLAAGEQRRAAEALDELPVSAAQSTPEFLPMLAAIEPAVLEQFPLLWMHAHAERRFSTSPQSLLDEIREIARRLPKEIDAERRFTVLRLLVVALGRVGKDREAETLVERYREQTGAPGVPRDVAEASLLHLSGYLALRAGRLSAWERVRSAIEPFFEASPPLAEAVLTERASYELPMLGRFSEAADVIRRLIARTRERGSKAPEISFLFGLSVSAWLNGDEPAFAQSVAEMRELADRARTPGTEFFLACAQGRTGATAGPLDSLHSRVWGHLIACGFAKTREVAGHHARLGDEAAAELGLPFTRVLTALARAECSPSERAAPLGELARLAGLSESQPLREAVESYLAGRPDATGMLAPTLRRFRELALAERDEIELALFTGTVSRNGKSFTSRIASSNCCSRWRAGKRRCIATRSAICSGPSPTATRPARRSRPACIACAGGWEKSTRSPAASAATSSVRGSASTFGARRRGFSNCAGARHSMPCSVPNWRSCIARWPAAYPLSPTNGSGSPRPRAASTNCASNWRSVWPKARSGPATRMKRCVSRARSAPTIRTTRRAAASRSALCRRNVMRSGRNASFAAIAND